MILWCDIETTGLSPTNDHILEIALILTDEQLVERSRFERVILPAVGGPVFEAQREEAVAALYKKANGFVQEMHESSDLWADILVSGKHPITVLLEIESWLKANGVGTPTRSLYLAGASVHYDRSMLAADPALRGLLAYVSHRHFDVSVFKRAFDWWNPAAMARLPQIEGTAHRAMPDIEHSLAEARVIMEMFRGEAEESNE